VVAYIGLGNHILGYYGWRGVVLWWIFQIAILIGLVLIFGFWNIVLYVLVPWNIVTFFVVKTAYKLETNFNNSIDTLGSIFQK
jgi:hypothetical protein